MLGAKNACSPSGIRLAHAGVMRMVRSSSGFPVRGLEGPLPPTLRLLRLLRVAGPGGLAAAAAGAGGAGDAGRVRMVFQSRPPAGVQGQTNQPGGPRGVGAQHGGGQNGGEHGGPGQAVPPRHTGPGARGTGDGGGRLNLLISWGGGGWRTDSWADALPSLLEPMGVRSVRVNSAREAERFIRTNNVHIAVVDLGLPINPPSPFPPGVNASNASASNGVPAAGSSMPTEESGGARVLELLRRLESPPPTVVVKAPPTRRDDARHIAAALRSDAFAVVDRAAADLELMLKVLHRCFDRYYQGRWPGGA